MGHLLGNDRGLLPLYLVTMLTVDFIEGTAEVTASIMKIFSGVLSDWLSRPSCGRSTLILGSGL
jgi:hypothetical protein